MFRISLVMLVTIAIWCHNLLWTARWAWQPSYYRIVLCQSIAVVNIWIWKWPILALVIQFSEFASITSWYICLKFTQGIVDQDLLFWHQFNLLSCAVFTFWCSTGSWSNREASWVSEVPAQPFWEVFLGSDPKRTGPVAEVEEGSPNVLQQLEQRS